MADKHLCSECVKPCKSKDVCLWCGGFEKKRKRREAKGERQRHEGD